MEKMKLLLLVGVLWRPALAWADPAAMQLPAGSQETTT